jgi:3-phosphoshikimate 1-carboxyvinyltransferase
LAAGAIAGGPVRVEGVGRDSIQGDLRFVEALEQMGASISMGENWVEARSNGALKAIDADFNHIPDAAMTIAVAALYADGPSTLRNIGSWRVKETDRLSGHGHRTAQAGRRSGGGRLITCASRRRPPSLPATIDTYDDHRMAMCFSLASLTGASTARQPHPHQRSEMRRQDLSRLLRGLCFDHQGRAVLMSWHSDSCHRHRWPDRVRQGHRSAPRRRPTGFSLPRFRRAVPADSPVALRQDTSLKDEHALAKLAEHLPCSFVGEHIYLGKEDVSQVIRKEEVGNTASRIAVLPTVRHALAGLQLSFRKPPGLVADGRDMGTVIFPHAQLKVFLTASVGACAEAI